MNKEKIIDKLKELLEYQKNIILEGPPGTSKTFTAFEIVKRELGIEEKDLPKYQFSIVNDKDSLQNGAWDIVQFHPSYSYEDFVQGIVAEPTNGSITFKVKDKLFSELCKFADKNKEKKFFLIIDEINRGDLSKIFGELIYGLEYRSEENKPNYIRTTYSELSIPDNLYIIGTMNTADRRIAMVDYALRRRFAFVTLSPNEETLKAFYGDGDDPKNKGLKEKAIDLFNQTQKIFKDEYKDYKLGHTYFMAKNLDHLRCKVEYQVKPILEEYKKEGIIDKIPDLKVEQK